MDQPLAGKTIAILVANGFEETEMTEPQRALLRRGAQLKIISPEQGLVNGWHGRAWGHYFPVDAGVDSVLAADYDMLLLPGGVRSVEKLKTSPHTRRIVSNFMDAGKPVAAMDEAIALLAVSERIAGRRVAGFEAVRSTMEAAGATVTDEAVVADEHLITAHDLANLDAFVERVAEVFCDWAELKKAA